MGGGVGRKQTNKSFERIFVSSTETKGAKRFSGFGLVWFGLDWVGLGWVVCLAEMRFLHGTI